MSQETPPDRTPSIIDLYNYCHTIDCVIFELSRFSGFSSGYEKLVFSTSDGSCDVSFNYPKEIIQSDGIDKTIDFLERINYIIGGYERQEDLNPFFKLLDLAEKGELRIAFVRVNKGKELLLRGSDPASSSEA